MAETIMDRAVAGRALANTTESRKDEVSIFLKVIVRKIII